VTPRFWTCAIVTNLSAFVSAYYSIAFLFAAIDSDGAEFYAASRSVALLIASLCCMAVRSRAGIAALAFVMILVQGFDAVIGALAHNPAITYAPFALAAANIVALIRLVNERGKTTPDAM
jgi:hypothetical protein